MCCGPSLIQRIAISQKARARDEAILEAVRRDTANNNFSSLLLANSGFSPSLAGFAAPNPGTQQQFINTSTSEPKIFSSNHYEQHDDDKEDDDDEEEEEVVGDGQRRVFIISDDDHSAGATGSHDTGADLGEARKKKRKRKRKKLEPGLTAKGDERQFVKHNYHDHANDSEEEYLACADKSHSNTGGVSVPFPFKLHEMLDAIEDDGYGSIVSWQPHGRCFKIHKKQEFVDTVMPRYFQQSKLTSFQRQLNLYGFIRLSRGRDESAYYHELFLRGKPFLCHKIVRCKCKGTRFKAASDPEAEPDFYMMPSVTASIQKHQEALAAGLSAGKHSPSVVSEESMDNGPNSPAGSYDFVAHQPVVSAPSGVEQLLSAVAAAPQRVEPTFEDCVVPMVIDCCLSEERAAEIQDHLPPPSLLPPPAAVSYQQPSSLTARMYGFDVPAERPPAYEYVTAVDPYPLSDFDWVGFGGAAPDVECDQTLLSVLSTLNESAMDESFIAAASAPFAQVPTVSPDMQDDVVFGDIVSTLLSEGIGESDFQNDVEFGRYLERLIE